MSTLNVIQRIILSAALFLPPLLNAAEQDYICEAKQSSKNALPVLSHDCPVGEGLWGKTPDSEQGVFWIQCGLSGIPMSFKRMQPIYSKISKAVFLKQEQDRYRCLVGPYITFSAAKSDLMKVRQLKAYKKAFIRDASSDNKLEPIVPATNSSPKVADIASPKPQKPVIRRQAKIGGSYFLIPFIMAKGGQYYMEHGTVWSRLSYDRALDACRSQQMRLPVAEEWQMLWSSKLMSDKRWPLQLPYWGEGKQGLFSDGKITQLSDASLLNVLCVK